MTKPALLFDLDGTLVDSARDIARALSIVSAARGGAPVAAATVRPLVSQGAPTLVREALGAFASDPVADLNEFRQVLAGLPVDRAILYPGVEEALTALAAKGHAIAIVTNKPEGLARALLVAVGIDRHFAAVVGGDTAEAPKPDRAPVDSALTKLGARAEDALFIGDSDVDAATARRCDIPFILFEGGYGAADCMPVDIAVAFADFGQLPGIIAGLGRPVAQ